MIDADIQKLQELAIQDNCDGECDLEPPHQKCPECEARHTLNEIGEIARDALKAAGVSK